MAFEQAVYLGDGGKFWKLSMEEWEKVCALGSDGREVDVTQFQKMRSRPSWLAPHPTGGGFYRTRKDRIYYEIRDWSPEDFRDALEELESIREPPET